jgi:TolB-like protein/tetratricopeptide (TPR) repeat protein
MSFFAELKRRNVVRVGIAYVIVGWLLAQVAEFAVENFGAPDWVLKIFVVFLILGLPLALFFAWAFELTPEGLVLEKHVDREESITHQTGRKLDFIIIAVMAVALIYMVADKFIGDPEKEEVTETTVPDDKSIAVLPFVNMSDDKDYFADGLSEELLNLLAKVPELKVSGRTSSFAFKDKTGDFRAIGDALGVSTILEGSVRRSGDRLRVTAQLINVADGFHIWSETYDREMADVFDIQDDVAGAITTALQMHLAPGALPAVARPTDNMEAYSLYVEALAMFRDSGGGSRPIALLDRALSLDPTFAKAHARKAMFYWQISGWLIDSPTGRGLVYESAQAALAIDPSLVLAQALLASAEPVNWNWTLELEALEKAIEAVPGDLALLDGYCFELAAIGYYQKALGVAERMIIVEPLSALGHARRGEALMGLGKRVEAVESWERAAESGFPGALRNAIDDHLMRGEDEQAIRLMNRLTTQYDVQTLSPDGISFRSFVESVRDPTNGKAYLDNAVDVMVIEATDFNAALIPYFWYLNFGYLDDFFDFIEKTAREEETSWNNSDALEYTGRYHKASGYTAHPRFLPHHEQWGVFDVWEERGPPDDCEKVDGNWVCE